MLGLRGPAATEGPPNALVYFVTAISVVIGLWARFHGLGDWSLSADEYYIARSVEDILRTGLPEFDCGGFYSRGILIQYVVAALQMTGMSAELSARLVAALASIVVLPAVYILGRRIHGPTVGLLAVCVLSLSTWEVDIARFGRMYAPFQAVFAWYLVHFLKYTVDREQRALRPMLILSVVGVLTWEGGVLMALANLLPPFIRSPDGAFSARDCRYLALCGAFAVVAYFFGTSDLRHLGTDAFPPGFDVTQFFANLDARTSAEPPMAIRDFDVGIRSPTGIIVGLIMFGFAAASTRWVWSLRNRWPALLGLLVTLAASLAHQFTLVVFTLTILLLSRILSWRDFASRDARPYVIAIAACVIGWTVVGISSPAWLSSLHVPWGEASIGFKLAYEFLRFPDFIGIVTLAFARAAPVLGAVLLVAIAVAILREVLRRTASVTAEQVLLLLVVSLLGAASLSNPPRLETRYFVFLFPVAVIFSVAMINRATQLLSWGRLAEAVITTTVVGALMYVSSDLQPRLLLRNDSTVALADRRSQDGDRLNIVRRTDTRGAAKWLAEHAGSPESLRINGFPGVDYYFNGFEFAFIGLDNHRYWTYACRQGTVERWGNLPLLTDVAAIKAQLKDRVTAYLVIDTPSSEDLMKSLVELHPSKAWTSRDGYISIFFLHNQSDVVSP
jgi:hypothetical protein